MKRYEIDRFLVNGGEILPEPGILDNRIRADDLKVRRAVLGFSSARVESCRYCDHRIESATR